MRIGQLADRFGVNPKTIRYYESIGLMPNPDRSPSGCTTTTTPNDWASSGPHSGLA